VERELKRLFSDLPPHFKKPSASDMIAALIIRVRRDPDGLRDDLASYIDDVRSPWEAGKGEHLPEL
jgi:hypothetical protein